MTTNATPTHGAATAKRLASNSSGAVGYLPPSYLPDDKFNAGAAASRTRATEREYFVQDSPRIGNAYLEDSVLRDVLKRFVPPNVLATFEPDLVRFGDRVVKEVTPLGNASERSPPSLLQVDGWGNKVDVVRTSGAWDSLLRIAAEEGLMAIGYERERYGVYARIYQFAKCYMYAQACAVADCPLAMTNGAIKLVDELDKSEASMKTALFSRLTSRDPNVAITSGQWMTERTGGSDVARTETLARHINGRDYELHGYKYFTSSINSAVAFGLARIVGADGSAVAGSRGLSLFQIDTRNADGTLNNIVVHKLKDKLGTKAVPTAELELRGTRATLVGDVGRGVSRIATLFNITRIHNAATSVAVMRRIVAVARDYSHRRSTSQALLAETPLHLATLAKLDAEFRGAMLIFMDASRALGASECAPSADARNQAARLLRVATPLLKLFTAKQAVAVASEGIECLGAHGYMEDSNVPRLLRDAQVLPIWEGTTNVLALDLLRVASHDSTAIRDFLIDCERRAGARGQQSLSVSGAQLSSALPLMNQSNSQQARELALAFATHYIAALCCEQADATQSDGDVFAAHYWLDLQLPNALRALSVSLAWKPASLIRAALDRDNADRPRSRDGLNVDARGVPRARL